MADSLTEHKIDTARESLLDAVEDLASLGWDESKIRAEVDNAITVAEDDGLFAEGE